MSTQQWRTGTEQAASRCTFMCEALHPGAFPCIVNVWPSALVTDTACADEKSNPRGSGSALLTPDSKAGCCLGSEASETGTAVSHLASPPSTGSARSATSILSDNTLNTDGTPFGSCHVALKGSGSLRKPAGGLSAALKAQPPLHGSDGPPSVTIRLQTCMDYTKNSILLPSCSAFRPAAAAPPAGPQSGCASQRSHLAPPDPQPSATATAPRSQQRRRVDDSPATASTARTSGASQCASNKGPTALRSAAPGAPTAAGATAALITDADADDGGCDGVSTALGSLSDALCDWVPNFSPSVVERLWTGRASAESFSPSSSRNGRHLLPPAAAREGSNSLRKCLQHLRQSSFQQLQQQRRCPLRRRSTVQDLKDGSCASSLQVDFGTPPEAPAAAGVGAGGAGAGGSSQPGAQVPCMALVAAAAAAAPAPRALGTPTRQLSNCSGGNKGTAAAEASKGVAQEAANATAAAPAAAPPPPPLPAAALGQSFDMELGMPSLGAAPKDGGCGDLPTTTNAAAANTATEEGAAAAAARAPSDAAAALAAMARAAYSEPRGHVHNGPRMPLYDSPVASSTARQQQQMQGPCPGRSHTTRVRRPGVEGGMCASGALSAALDATTVSMSGVGLAGLPALPTAAAAAAPPTGARNDGADPWVSAANGTTSGGNSSNGMIPDSPISQASTVWENPQAPGSYVVRDLHRPSKWFGDRRGTARGAGRRAGGAAAGSSGSIASAAGLVSDGRTRWWNLTGKFSETDNAGMHRQLFPHEEDRSSGEGYVDTRRRQTGFCWQWWKPAQ